MPSAPTAHLFAIDASMGRSATSLVDGAMSAALDVAAGRLQGEVLLAAQAALASGIYSGQVHICFLCAAPVAAHLHSPESAPAEAGPSSSAAATRTDSSGRRVLRPRPLSERRYTPAPQRYADLRATLRPLSLPPRPLLGSWPNSGLLASPTALTHSLKNQNIKETSRKIRISRGMSTTRTDCGGSRPSLAGGMMVLF